MSMSEILISGLLIIIGVVVFTHVINGINKRIDDLKELFKAELRVVINPINEKLSNHVTESLIQIRRLMT